ncbi:MAG: hypothetical protein WCL19_03250 [Verrucomicrobiota bacterium]
MPLTSALRLCLLLSVGLANAYGDDPDRLTAMEKDLSAMRKLLLEQAAQNKRLSEEVEQLKSSLPVKAKSVNPPVQALESAAAWPAPSPEQGKEVMAVDSSKKAEERGVTISMLNEDSNLTISGDFNFMSMYSNRHPFVPGSPLYLLPLPPEGTSDFNGRQSRLNFAFTGPDIGDWHVGALAVFGFQNSLTAEGYGFGPYVAYGEIKNEDWRFAAGLQYDVINPRDPKTIPNTLLGCSGNIGASRNQIRIERFFHPDEDWQATLQLALSDPITTRIVDNSSVLEDDGHPNLEGRLNFGIGKTRDLAGHRTARPIEIAASGLLGGMRTLEGVGNGNLRQTPIKSWGLGTDLHVALTDRVGISGEFFSGEGIGEYLGGIGQSYNKITGNSISASGGWGELYAYLSDDLHLHLGYGIDAADRNDLGTGYMLRNETAFGTLVWDLDPRLQLSFEMDYRRTSYLGSRGDELFDGLIYMSGITWKF